MPSATPKIAILGAGPSGLMLARILHLNNVPCTIYELDADAKARIQGGSLDLHTETGQAAIRKAQLWNGFQKYARYEGEETYIVDKLGNVEVHLQDQSKDRPEIDRGHLRNILLDSVPESMIKWGHKVKKVEKNTIHFEHGLETGFDLIVGADGAWSKVRPHLTTVTPFYSGITGIEINVRNLDTKHPELSTMLGNGTYFALGEAERRCLLIQRQSDRSVRIYCVDWRPENWIQASGLDFTKPEEIRAALLEEYKNFSPELQDVIRYCDDDINGRPLYMLPPGLRWGSQPGFTVIGDAAHVCTPFAGIGVNAALTDAMKLAEAIIKDYSTGNLDNAIRNYEQWMFPVATRLTSMTWENLLARFGEGGIAQFKARVERALKEKERKRKEKEEQEQRQAGEAARTLDKLELAA